MVTTRPSEQHIKQVDKHDLEWIGIFGGTFDPIHYGHLRPALDVLQQLNLTRIHFVPCYQPVHRGTPQASSAQRAQMVKLALADYPQCVFDSIELDRQGPSYMVDTLASLKQRLPQAGLVLIMGMDAFAKFMHWHQWQTILTLANIAVMHRPGELMLQTEAIAGLLAQHQVTHLSKPAGQVIDVAVTQLDLSATQIRDLIKHNETTDSLVPKAVQDFIDTNRLYQKG
ncbi:nicotinate-nucleotide adenylyltransferase [Thiomicrospira sp. ALE5]|uniref:nicotinate-nucleotide adenylyltransferase n=1 Tax=Thiomicrospira sp. ALE5 TaxID=748650 RepID=UPI0008F0FBA0|nr:nicotinate-nucleotide adenylyltransferase [Thiomicrospira sp. ALE5]SFR55422.1 nicotinate-nucleotide adenylyltransferase [Thiomicrospira sp. ALE5]